MPDPVIRAVTFDAAHTLFHPYPSVGAIYREVMLAHGLDYAQSELEAGFSRAFATQGKDRTILDGERREWSYWRAVVAESIRALEPPPADFDALFAELWETFAHASRWQPARGAAETLRALNAQGVKTALLTNWDGRVRNLLAENGYDQLLHHIFISSEIGHEKPDPEIFRHAQQVLGLPAAQIAHVGDSLQHDIEGALQAGWQAFRLIDANGSEVRRDQNELSTLADLLDRLGIDA